MRNYSVTVKIDGLPKMINATSFNNWRVVYAERKKWKERTAMAFSAHIPDKPLSKAKITITRHSSRCGDYDGIVSSSKSILDGLKLAKIIEDDNMNVIGIPDFKWEKAPPKKGYIVITVESV